MRVSRIRSQSYKLFRCGRYTEGEVWFVLSHSTCKHTHARGGCTQRDAATPSIVSTKIKTERLLRTSGCEQESPPSVSFSSFSLAWSRSFGWFEQIPRRYTHARTKTHARTRKRTHESRWDKMGDRVLITDMTDDAFNFATGWEVIAYSWGWEV